MLNDPTMEELQTYIDAIEAQRDPDDNEIEAYARMKNRVEAELEALHSQYKREEDKLLANYEKMQKELYNRDKAIEWKYGEFVKQAVAAKIAGQKQRSVKTLFGVVGYRKQAAKIVRRIREGRREELMAWADQYCKVAVVEKRTYKVDKDKLPETCPHIYDEQIPESDNFYWRPAKVEEKEDA